MQEDDLFSCCKYSLQQAILPFIKRLKDTPAVKLRSPFFHNRANRLHQKCCAVRAALLQPSPRFEKLVKHIWKRQARQLALMHPAPAVRQFRCAASSDEHAQIPLYMTENMLHICMPRCRLHGQAIIFFKIKHEPVLVEDQRLFRRLRFFLPGGCFSVHRRINHFKVRRFPHASQQPCFRPTAQQHASFMLPLSFS